MRPTGMAKKKVELQPGELAQWQGDDEPTEEAVSMALDGLTHVFTQAGEPLLLRFMDERAAARLILRRAIRGFELHTRARAAVAKDEADKRADRHRQNWAAVSNEKDRYVARVSDALSKLDDRELAARLANECGVILYGPGGRDS